MFLRSKKEEQKPNKAEDWTLLAVEVYNIRMELETLRGKLEEHIGKAEKVINEDI